MSKHKHRGYRPGAVVSMTVTDEKPMNFGDGSEPLPRMETLASEAPAAIVEVLQPYIAEAIRIPTLFGGLVDDTQVHAYIRGFLEKHPGATLQFSYPVKESLLFIWALP